MQGDFLDDYTISKDHTKKSCNTEDFSILLADRSINEPQTLRREDSFRENRLNELALSKHTAHPRRGKSSFQKQGYVFKSPTSTQRAVAELDASKEESQPTGIDSSSGKHYLTEDSRISILSWLLTGPSLPGDRSPSARSSSVISRVSEGNETTPSSHPRDFVEGDELYVTPDTEALLPRAVESVEWRILERAEEDEDPIRVIFSSGPASVTVNPWLELEGKAPDFGSSNLKSMDSVAENLKKRPADAFTYSQERSFKRQMHNPDPDDMVTSKGISSPADCSPGNDFGGGDIDRKIFDLKSQIKALEAIKRDQIPHEWRVIYRVDRPQFTLDKDRDKRRARDPPPVKYFLDQPRWYGGIEGHEPLEGTVPILDVDSYLERHGELAFVIIQEYGRNVPDGVHFSRIGEPYPVEEGYPLPCAESAIFIFPDMLHTMKIFLSSLQQDDRPLFRQDELRHEEMQAPYLAIYHNRQAFDSMIDALPERERHLWTIFKNYLDSGFKEEYSQVSHQLQEGLVSPRFLKYLINPGDVLYCPHHPVVEAVQAVSPLHFTTQTSPNVTPAPPKLHPDNDNWIYPERAHRKRTWLIETTFWSFEISFQRERQTLKLEMSVEVDETVPISTLQLYPIRFAAAGIEQRISARGAQFWKCRNRRFVEYSKDELVQAWINSKSRYMIDPVTYKRMHGNTKSTDELSTLGDLTREEFLNKDCPAYPFPMLLPRTIQGFNFTEKKWVDLEVDFITDVKWNSQAFKNLVTEQETKDLIEALVKNQLKIETSTDLIAGKGNGLIILLHGGPGTGKTYTAESVADYAQKPLYRVTCGDIGTKPLEVEKYLEKVLRLGQIWGCVVLLDEADIFLEERSLQDLDRNALVSVFLRVLEYYDGILILTSNRVGSFDEAFRSRIQLALPYGSLNQEQRYKIWGNFIKHLSDSKSCKMDFTDLALHLTELSQHEMNGRQIRNAITTARQLAEFQNEVLNYENIMKVIRVSGRFDKYLRDVKTAELIEQGTVDDGIARDERIR